MMHPVTAGGAAWKAWEQFREEEFAAFQAADTAAMRRRQGFSAAYHEAAAERHLFRAIAFEEVAWALAAAATE